MRILYFIQIAGISGNPRVVKNLGRQLVASEQVEFVPVCWSIAKQALVKAPQEQLKNFARHGGPELPESAAAGEPVLLRRGDWLLFAEVPHLGGDDWEYPPISIIEPIGYARRFGARTAAIFHDIMPLFHRGSANRRIFLDMLQNAGASNADGELDRLRFTVYAQAMASADVVLPVSQASGTKLRDWLLAHGHAADRLPAIRPVLLPEEISGVARVRPELVAPAPGAIEFLTVGTLCAHNNQLSAMTAFGRLSARRPELDLRLHVVGSVTSDCAVPASLIAKRSGGRIQLHGHAPDAALVELRRRVRASVFVSLAEGYGLPVAESLWHGKPCLCSNDGSIAEIARGGGCLTVDPRNLVEIEAGFETLAADASAYEALLRQLATRQMKTWSDYAAAVTSELAIRTPAQTETDPMPIVEAGEALGEGVRPDSTQARRAPPEGRFVISIDDLKIRQEYNGGDGRPTLRQGEVLHYVRAHHSSISAGDLFYGPYASLSPGYYAFTFDGEIDGELNLAFTAEDGRRPLETVALTSFAEPVRVCLPEPADRFELVGKKTEALNRFTLRSIAVEFREKAAAGSSVQETRPARDETVQDRPAVRDRKGVALSLPYVLEAAKLHLHAAFHKDGRNRLQASSGIAFDCVAHADVREKTLFFGPYFHFDAGNYIFRLRGTLEGALRLRIVHLRGAERILDTVVTAFDEPIRISLQSAVDDLEIIGRRTDETRTVKLLSVEIDK